MLKAGGRRLLGQILKDSGKIGEGQVQEALAQQRESGGLLGEVLVGLGHCTVVDVTHGLAEQAGLRAVDLSREAPTPEALERVDASTAHAFGVLPLSLEEDVLEVALGDPLNTSLLEDLRFSTGLDVVGALGDAEQIAALVRTHYGEEASVRDAIADASGVRPGDEDAASSAPVVRLLNSILHRAVRDRASDVHFEVFPGELRIRFRVDGSLYEIEAPPAHLAAPLVARIKVLSSLDIAETKLPQDGRIAFAIDGRPVDLRVATLPAISGEGCVLRVLDRSSVSLELSALGLEEHEQAALIELTHLPHGIVLVTGPTGSGKTTTLYAMLSEANRPDVKIVTVEDPVEYDIEGIVQIPIHEDIGVDYAKILRTVLRQDPDKILVGEIRDAETAAVAVEASLTGHTVFATVHTNDAPSAIARLLDLGLEPFLVTATLEAIVAQRLVRKVCTQCRVEVELDSDRELELSHTVAGWEDAQLVRGRGCEACFHTGYRGRTAIVEIMRMDEGLREAILQGKSTDELSQLARASGMKGLRERGLEVALRGGTTVEEVLRETMAAGD